MEYKKFHIFDFPADKIRILFKGHKKFIDNAVTFCGSRDSLANSLNVTPQLISQWRKYCLFMPLSSIKKIAIKQKLRWLDIEKNISAYKGISTGIPITNPKIPIKETPELFELITHIICDGCVNKNGIPCYVNSEKKLIENFKKILRNCFGKINGKLYEIKRGSRVYYEYRFPKIIVELLEDFYNLSFYKTKKFPFRIFLLPKKFAISVIRAFADDEGSIDLNRRIEISSANNKLLKNLLKLLKDKLHYKNISSISEKDKSYYHFYIKPKDIKRYKKEIGFIHPEKIKKLKDVIYFRTHGYKPGQHAKPGETKEKLLNLLSGRLLSTYGIMKEININKSNINLHLKRLINKNLVVQHHKNGQTIFWTGRK